MVQCIFREWESRNQSSQSTLAWIPRATLAKFCNSFAPNISICLVGTFIGTFLPSVKKVVRRKVVTCFRYSELFERNTLLKARTLTSAFSYPHSLKVEISRESKMFPSTVCFLSILAQIFAGVTSGQPDWFRLHLLSLALSAVTQHLCFCGSAPASHISPHCPSNKLTRRPQVLPWRLSVIYLCALQGASKYRVRQHGRWGRERRKQNGPSWGDCWVELRQLLGRWEFSFSGAPGFPGVSGRSFRGAAPTWQN